VLEKIWRKNGIQFRVGWESTDDIEIALGEIEINKNVK
jgi:hypothetical protein